MAVISMKALLESGVHFGHRTHKWNPAMRPFIFTERNGIHIIDLQKTSKALDQAYALVRDKVSGGGTMLFVGTKRQAQDTIQTESARCGMPSVTARWLGGMLTNWRTIRARINELDRLERMRDSGDFGRITKKEGLILRRKIVRLETLLSGMRKMNSLPDVLFVVDIRREATAIHEANLLNIPVVAMVDTNCDPRDIDYVIPSNDDAIRAIKLIVGKMADAILEGKALRKDMGIEEEAGFAARGLVEEPELSDEELLGESTLAKLSSQARPRPDIMEDVIADLVAVTDEDLQEAIEVDFAEEGVEAEFADDEGEEVDIEDLVEVTGADLQEDIEVDFAEEDVEVEFADDKIEEVDIEEEDKPESDKE